MSLRPTAQQLTALALTCRRSPPTQRERRNDDNNSSWSNVCFSVFSPSSSPPPSIRPSFSSSRSSDGNSSLLDEGGSASQVPQATEKLAGYGSRVWPDSLSEWLVDGAGLQQVFCCLTASTARALLFMADAEFEIQVMVESGCGLS